MNDFFDAQDEVQIDFPAQGETCPIVHRLEWGATKGISAAIKADWENYKHSPYAPKYGLRYWDKDAKVNVQVTTCNFAVVAILSKLQGKKSSGKNAEGKEVLTNAWSNYVRDTRNTPFVVKYNKNTIYKGLYKVYSEGAGKTPANDFLEYKAVMVLYVAELGLCEIESATFISAMVDAANMATGKKVKKFDLPLANVAYNICGETFMAAKSSSEYFIAPNFCIRGMGAKGIANVAAQRDTLNEWLDKHEAFYTELAGQSVAPEVSDTDAPLATYQPPTAHPSQKDFAAPQPALPPASKSIGSEELQRVIDIKGISAAEAIAQAKQNGYDVSTFVESVIKSQNPASPESVEATADDLPF